MIAKEQTLGIHLVIATPGPLFQILEANPSLQKSVQAGCVATAIFKRY
jgi:hypothetical protein